MPAPSLRCPAALPLTGVIGEPSVLCGELVIANDGAHIRGFVERGQVSPVMSGDQDRSVIASYCAGPGVPGSACSYTACPFWVAAKEARWAARKGPDAMRDETAARPPAVRDQVARAA